MIRIIFISILFVALLPSCSTDESKLEGKWKLIQEVNNKGNLVDAKFSEAKNVTYEFHDHNRYSVQGIASGNEEENLITKTGAWELSTLKDETSEEKTLQLLLREERLEGILEMKYKIDTIAKEKMIWADARNNKFYFSKITE